MSRVNVDEFGFIASDEQIDQNEYTNPYDDEEIIELVRDKDVVDKCMLGPNSTVLLSDEEFREKIQKLLRTKAKKSILKVVDQSIYPNTYTNSDLDKILTIRQFDQNKVKKATGLKHYYTLREEATGHHYLDYRHLWRSEIKTMEESHNEMLEHYQKLIDHYNVFYDNIYDNSISKKINDKFSKKYCYEQKIIQFVARANSRRNGETVLYSDNKKKRKIPVDIPEASKKRRNNIDSSNRKESSTNEQRSTNGFNADIRPTTSDSDNINNHKKSKKSGLSEILKANTTKELSKRPTIIKDYTQQPGSSKMQIAKKTAPRRPLLSLIPEKSQEIKQKTIDKVIERRSKIGFTEFGSRNSIENAANEKNKKRLGSPTRTPQEESNYRSVLNKVKQEAK